MSSINFLAPANISTPAILLAAKNQVPVLFYNSFGRVEAWVRSPSYHNISNIRKAQAYFTDSFQGVDWAKRLLKQKNEGQIACLHYLGNRFVLFKQLIHSATDKMSVLMPNLAATQTAEQIMGYEGKISSIYWETIASILANTIQIEGRIHQNPPDIFNASINYGYGILYGMIEGSLLMVGLDPYMGILHTNRYQLPALAFDHIEPFRPWVDEMIIALIMQNKLIPSDLSLNEEQLYRLNLNARKTIIDTFFAKMEERTYLNGKRIKNKDHINYLSSLLVNKLKAFHNLT